MHCLDNKRNAYAPVISAIVIYSTKKKYEIYKE